MSEIMLALGAYRFSIATAAYERLRRSTAWRWPTQARIGTHPLHQFVGPDTTTIALNGKLYPHYRALAGLPEQLSRDAQGDIRVGRAAAESAGVWQLERLRADASDGAPLLLVDGRGGIWGYWCVLKLEETERAHLDTGAALAVDFSVELAYYGDAPPADWGGGFDWFDWIGGLIPWL